MLLIGSNPAEAHPVATQHLLRAKENGAKMLVIDPRFTRTAAHADQFMRIRPGTDVPLIWGMLSHVFKNAWEDVEYIEQRVYGMDNVAQEVLKRKDSISLPRKKTFARTKQHFFTQDTPHHRSFIQRG